ncbi:hypothetical protein NIES4074_21650 [Cylindrospermum sp. NIES-4074]|nr:hypothetical protein NIES4074_21650 [Cylindrospermum sp. NIES-4074]
MTLTLNKTFKPISTKIVSDTPGRLRLRVAPGDREVRKMQIITDVIKAQSNVSQVRANFRHGSILINHSGKEGSLENVLATLKDIGIIFADITQGNSEAAVGVSSAVVDLNRRVEEATNGVADLRFLFPLGLSLLAARQLMLKGLQLEVIPWYVLAWYAFDIFIKLHGTDQTQSENRV